MRAPSPVKSRGQHFLTDVRVVQKIAGLLDLGGATTVVEIGPGRGALTGALLETGREVVAIESDARMIDYLKSRHGSGLHLVHASVLDVEAARVLSGRKGRAVLVGNLPYNLSGPILEWIFRSAPRWHQVVIMLQLEVVRRLVAPPATRDFGPLAVACALHFKSTRRFLVRPGAFFPAPAVTSAVVELNPTTHPPLRAVPEEVFLRFVHTLFAHRRKNLRNNLQAASSNDTADWDDVLRAARLDGRLRAEQLSWRDLSDLYEAAKPHLSPAGHVS